MRLQDVGSNRGNVFEEHEIGLGGWQRRDFGDEVTRDLFEDLGTELDESLMGAFLKIELRNSSIFNYQRK